MYRTYRELYRTHTEITKIGKGEGALKIGKYLSVGLDVILLSAAVGLFPGFFMAALLHAFYHPVSRILWQLVIAFVTGWAVRQFDPQGKSALTWSVDLFAFVMRKHLTDGFHMKGIQMEKNPRIHRFSFYAVDQGIARSTPIYGRGDFTLHKPLAIKVLRDGSWMLKRARKKTLEPGKYRVVDGQIRRIKEAPALRRNPFSF